MKRYHPFHVALHWLMAIMLLVSLLVGGPALTELDNSDPEKLFGLTGHMIWGLIIGALQIARLITRLLTTKPAPADAGNASLNLGAKLAHLSFYLLILAMVGSGLGLALSADLFAIVFAGSGAPLPADFHAYSMRMIHGLIANLLLTLIALHLAGWAYHQFVLKDRLLSRMWFGKRS